MGDDETLSDSRLRKQTTGIHSHYLYSATNIELLGRLRLDLDKTSTENFDHIDRIACEQFCFSGFITQSDVKMFHIFASFY